MRQVINIQLRFDDTKFAQRPEDLQHAALEGVRSQFGPDAESGIEVHTIYDSTKDPNWAASQRSIYG